MAMRTIFGLAGKDASARLAMLKPSRPALTAAAVLAIALIVSILGSAVTYTRVDAAYKQQTIAEDALDRLDSLLRSQLDEETGLRGYLASGQRSFLSPYNAALPKFRSDLEQLQADLQRAHLTDGIPVVFDLRHSHNLWQDEIAKPLLAHPTTPSEMALLQRGKVIVDHIRADFQTLTTLLEDQSKAAADNVRTLLLRAAILTAMLILLFGVTAIVADVVRSRMQLSLERERVVGDTLGRAFLSGWEQCSYLEVGTAYISAVQNLAIGGDLYDIHIIDDHRCLLLVADVSGKGLDAAVDTAYVKYSLRALAEACDDPAIILKKFNLSFLRSIRDESSFVSLFAAILDGTTGVLHYSSAGHSPVYLRRSDDVRPLTVTGPLIGLRPEDEFPAALEVLEPGDVLVLATDGLTEARDTSGMMIDDAGAMRIVRDAPLQPQRMADFMVSEVTRASAGRTADDLAILAVKLVAQPRSSVQAQRHLATASGA